MSRFPSRDLRAQNRCVLKRSARLDRRRVDDRKSSTPERARKLRFLSNGLFSLLVERSLPFTLQKSTPHIMGSKTRGSQSASSIPSVTKRGKKNAMIQTTERDIETQKTYFLTVLLTENAYSPTGSCDRTLIDSLFSSSSSFWDNNASSLLVVGAAPTLVPPPRTDRDISSSSSSSQSVSLPLLFLRAEKKRVSLSRLCCYI